MDGIHDLGGKHGFGQVVTQEYSPDEIPFPERWQASVFAMVRSLYAHGVTHNTDQFRHAIERIDPQCYLSDGYYGRWLGAIETLLVEAGVLTQAEVSARQRDMNLPDTRIAARPASSPDVFQADQQLRAETAQRNDSSVSQFNVGDPVVCQVSASMGHTRLPAYLRGVQGQVVACHGRWVFPDTNAHGLGENPQHLYTVEFDGTHVWAHTGEEKLSVCIDLFEPYLEGVVE